MYNRNTIVVIYDDDMALKYFQEVPDKNHKLHLVGRVSVRIFQLPLSAKFMIKHSLTGIPAGDYVRILLLLSQGLNILCSKTVIVLVVIADAPCVSINFMVIV